MPFDVFLDIAGRGKFHPSPKGPLPAPESYWSDSLGPNPSRPALVGMGTAIDAVPFAAFTLNFSPMPPIEDPPVGKEMDGKVPDRLIDSECCGRPVPALASPGEPAVRAEGPKLLGTEAKGLLAGVFGLMVIDSGAAISLTKNTRATQRAWMRWITTQTLCVDVCNAQTVIASFEFVAVG